MPRHDEGCLHEEDFKRLEGLVTKVFEKMDAFLTEMHAAMVADAVRSEKMNQLERDLNNISGSLRGAKDDIKALGYWRQRFEGGVKVMLAIPILCTVITTAFAIYHVVK